MKKDLGHERAPHPDQSSVTEESCPVCGYDCAGANPPPMYCPMEGRKEKRVTAQVDNKDANLS